MEKYLMVRSSNLSPLIESVALSTIELGSNVDEGIESAHFNVAIVDIVLVLEDTVGFYTPVESS